MTSIAMSTMPLFNCSTIMDAKFDANTYDNGTLGMMNSVPSPVYSQSSVDSQESSNHSVPSPMSVSFSPQSLQNIVYIGQECVESLGLPFLRIIEEPVEKFRFRYKSEMMGTHGSILGRNSDKNRKKSYPSVELCNYNGPAIVRCSLYTANSDINSRTPHTHRLVVRVDNDDKDDPHEIIVSNEVGYTAVFQGMGIIHTAKKNITDELMKKKRARLLEVMKTKNINLTSLPTKDEINIRHEAEVEAKKMNLNSVTLYFEAFMTNSNGFLLPICQSVFSKPINNMKSALTGELKICRIDKHVSSCMGGEEVFILVEKVGKKNIRIKFFEIDEEDNEIWCDFGKFSELDVHHQYAIVFRTPPYRDLDIDKTVDVYLQLYRPTDGDCSEPIKFSYKPSEKLGRTRKRQRSSAVDDVPVAVVTGHRNFNGPPVPTVDLTHNLLNPHSDPLLPQETDDSCDLLNILNDENAMNSTEFKEYMKNLSLSDYVDTVLEEDYMDLATDGACRRAAKKAVSSKKATPNIDARGSPLKRDIASIKDIVKKEPLSPGEEESTEKLARDVVSQLTELMQEKPPPRVLSEKITKIFATKNDFGDNALHSAILNDQRDLLKQMLTVLGRGQNLGIINSRNKITNTPLHCAVLQNQYESVRSLLAVGADPNAVNRNGDTALHLAVVHCHDKCLDELLEKSNYLMSSIKPQCNIRNYKGWTPLHLGALNHNLSVVQKLVEAGADVNELDSTHGRSVLHIAVEEGDKDITRFLVTQTNIDVNLANYSGNTALHVACVVGEKGSPELCEILLAYKADPHKANYEQRSLPSDTPKHNPDIVEVKDEVNSEEDSDDEVELQIDVEENDEYDGDEEDPKVSQGQTSFDLASNNKDILKILKKVDSSMECRVECTKSSLPPPVDVKEEMCMSPISDCTLTDDNGLFDEETLQHLCDILDKSKSWVNLADLLDYGFLAPSIRNATSPSKLLFNYADLHGSVTVQDIRNFLEALDEHQAVEAVDLMLAKQLATAEEQAT